MSRNYGFAVEDRVEWTREDDGGFYAPGVGTIKEIDGALGKAYVTWDSGDYGWAFLDELVHADAITRLGDLAR